MFNKTKKSISLDSKFVNLESTGFSAKLAKWLKMCVVVVFPSYWAGFEVPSLHALVFIRETFFQSTAEQ